MNENQFAELRTYFETDGCIDMGYRPLASLITRGWIEEVVRGCWAITEAGTAEMNSVIKGTKELR